MLSSQSIQLIFSSWDVIKNIPDFQEVFSNQLSEKLSDSVVSEWFSGPANPHHLVFVKMIDLIVHLLGPDLDVILEELTSQGRRHHRYHSDMIGFFHVDIFSEIADAFIAIVSSMIQEQASAKDPNEVLPESSVLHPNQLEEITKAWSAIFTMMRAIMKQGVKIEVKRHQRRAEKKRQEILAKQERRTSDSDTTKPMSESDSDTASLDLSSHSNHNPSSTTKRQPRKGGKRGIGRAVSSTLESMRSPPGRSSSGIRAGLAMLGSGSNHNKKKSSKLAALSEQSSPSSTKSNGNSSGSRAAPLRRGIRSSLSMKRLTVSRS
ncbi:unnamed protein product [Cylindrotheca closterium]|uniref:Globin family profile domain-containing protein n=1 Tax=Cylindrotheca closterium TaxID=2856 RepID=A0AAD2FEJ6_9STRA|nr:unnamed protein product [Cylindrotheca closterium]